MSVSYEVTRKYFNIITRKYQDYVNLYKHFNNGSVDGITSFSDFYWRMTYFGKYDGSELIDDQGV